MLSLPGYYVLTRKSNYIDRLDFIDISVLEIENPDFNVKKTTIKIKEKFKSCKILILIPEMNEKIENFICEFSIDAYLTFPVLPFQLIRILYCLKEV